MIRSYNRDKHEAGTLSSTDPASYLNQVNSKLGLLMVFPSVQVQLHLWCLKMVSPCLFCPSCLHEVSVGGVQEGTEEISL